MMTTTDATDRRGALLEYATAVASAEDAATVFDEMTNAAETLFEFSSAVVETEENGVLSVRSWSGTAPDVAGIRADEGIAGDTYQTGETVCVSDVLDDDRVGNATEDMPRSVVTVPVGDVGVFQATLDEVDAFDDEDVELVELLAAHAARAIERIRSQQKLAESEQRFRSLVEKADDALVLYDAQRGKPGAIELANGAAEELFGAPESELRNTTLDALLDADAETLVPATGGHKLETTLADSNDVRVMEVRVKPFLDESGPDAFAIISDVTEQRHRERILTSLHDATRSMLVADDRNDIARVMVDAAGALLDLQYVSVFYADGDELRPAAISELPGDETPVLRAGESIAWEVYETGEPQWVADVLNHPNVHDHDTRIVEEFIAPLGDHGVFLAGSVESGELTRSDRDLANVLATNGEAALDRAERVRMLQEREAELRRERNRLAALFENVPSPTASFVVEDGTPVVKSVNPAFEDVFGYEESELVGESIDDYIVPPKAEGEAALYNKKLQAGQNVNVEVRRLTADGARDFLLDVVPFRLDEPNVQGYAMYTDITDRKERERELERQNDRLEEFASIVSHDLRNPLNVARGYVELAQETGSEEHFERIDTALDRMHDIVADVLTLARQGRSLEDTVDVDLRDASEDAWQNVSTKDASLVVTDDSTLSADPTRFGSLLENLFGNAVEHGSTGPDSQTRQDAVEHGSTSHQNASRSEDAVEHAGADVTVTVGTIETEAGDGVEGFYVADDGVGIPEDQRDAVFKSGETFSEDGTGFGLAIVESIAEAHGWRVELTESESGGARFEFLPGGSAVVSSSP